MTPSPNTKHQRLVGRLYLLLGNWVDATGLGEVFVAPYDVVLSRFDIVEPDLLYFSSERRATAITPQHATAAPSLVIEIGSPGTRKRDETIKRRLYERTGVDEYWVVDPDLDAVRVYRRTADGFDRAFELSRERQDVLTSPILPGLDLPLSSIFRD